MKKKKASQKEKGFLALAGEAFGVLGEEIVEGKDKLVEAASERIAALKKTIKKIGKKKPIAKRKASPKKSAKKAVAIKTVKKAAPKKVAKKAAPKKAVAVKKKK